VPIHQAGVRNQHQHKSPHHRCCES
jgi:hypothetical protein